MTGLYLVGEPLFKPGLRDQHYAPIGQMRLCQEVLRETQNMDVIVEKLRAEYLAIVYSLKEMGINFRIIYCHENAVDKRMLGLCIQHLGCKLAGFGLDSLSPQAVAYPRDFATILPGLVLLNSGVSKVLIKRKDGYRIFASSYGEGGRVLSSGNTMLVCERLINWNKKSTIKPAELENITRMGIRVGLLPLPITGAFTAAEIKEEFIPNDHLDRVACLIRGKDGKLHLIVDPLIGTADWGNPNQGSWGPRFPKETIEKIKFICHPLGIEVHYPKKIGVPYALNLIQFSDNRVLMTSGDELVAELISEIVGEENVFKTPTSIRYFPVWLYAGIRCLVSEAPEPLFKSVASV